MVSKVVTLVIPMEEYLRTVESITQCNFLCKNLDTRLLAMGIFPSSYY